MKKHVLLTLFTSALTITAISAHAGSEYCDEAKKGGHGYSQHHGGKHGERHHGKRHGGQYMLKRLTKKLDLTEDQQAQLKTFRDDQKAKNDTLREQMKALRTEMHALDTQSADYDSQVAALADKKADLGRQMFIQRAATRQHLESILTDEQRTKFKALQEKHHNR